MQDTFDTTRTFENLGLRKDLIRAVDDLGFVHPTHIQSQLIPVACTGKDVLGQAKTGSGKTAAFALPILHQLKPDESLAALVLVPTRELAIQVCKEVAVLGRHTGLEAVPIYGGQPIRKQVARLERNPAIIVGTPGRVMDMHQRRYLPYDKIRIAVLDEVDRMLDIGFRDDIRKILGGLPGKPQTIFVSATISTEIERLARKYMQEPEKIVTVAKSLTVQQVKQSYLSVEPWDKKRLLVHLLTHESPALTVVFCRTKRTVDDLAKILKNAKIDAHAIHGDMYQGKRNRVMDRLREGKLKVLVASDLAARGLDVDDITHIINYDIPEDPEVYVHRIGRTARAGRDGIAWSLVTPEQGQLLTNIEMLTNVEITRMEYDDFTPGPIPGDVTARREAERSRVENRTNRLTQAAPPAEQNVSEDKLAELFPGGIVPSGAPARSLGGRVRTRRR